MITVKTTSKGTTIIGRSLLDLPAMVLLAHRLGLKGWK